jgi:uncharacterized protein YecT (DUF1311 family)
MRNTILLAAVGVAALMAATPAFATDETDLAKCRQSGATAKQIACLYAVRDKENIRLNREYRKVISAANAVSSEAGRTLKKSELAWISFRDEWCEFQAVWEGGTLGNVAKAYCLALLTRQRADELAFYAKAATP